VGGCGCGCVWEYCTVLYDCFRIGRVAGGVVAHAATTTTNVHRMIISQYGVVSMIIIAWSHAAGNLGPHSAKRPKKGESGSSKAPGHITAQHVSSIGSNTAVLYCTDPTTCYKQIDSIQLSSPPPHTVRQPPSSSSCNQWPRCTLECTHSGLMVAEEEPLDKKAK
jgi:hypothetical protein